MVQPQEVIEFWFGTIAEDGSVAPEQKKLWWKKDPAFDTEIRERFGDAIAAAEAGELDSWLDTPEGSIAFVILLDQFTRNTRRNKAEMYAADDKAVAAVRHALEKGHDQKLRSMQTYFLLMPLMHAEDLACQNECIERFEALAKSGEAGAIQGATGGAEYARKHMVIVERFGRFPHRNGILGRESTPEEVAFLEEPGSSF